MKKTSTSWIAYSISLWNLYSPLISRLIFLKWRKREVRMKASLLPTNQTRSFLMVGTHFFLSLLSSQAAVVLVLKIACALPPPSPCTSLWSSFRCIFLRRSLLWFSFSLQAVFVTRWGERTEFASRALMGEQFSLKNQILEREKSKPSLSLCSFISSLHFVNGSAICFVWSVAFVYFFFLLRWMKKVVSS